MPRWLTLFPWFVMVCALLFSAGIVVFGLHNAKRESDFTSQLTLEKGAALISALEGALRTGMGYHWSDEVLSDLLNKVGEQPDIVSLVITNRNGTVLMAADTKLIGTSFLSPEVLAELDPTRQVKWNATELPDGMPVFQVYKQFSVPQGERRRHGGGHRMMRRGLDGDSCGMLEASIAEGTSLVIFVEYDLTPLEEAQAADEKHMAVMFGILVFVGLVGCITLFLIQSYRRSRKLVQETTAFSSEILRKLHKSDKIGNLNSDQFLLSLLSMPDMWMRVPFIALSNKELANYYDLTDGECAYLQAFDNKGDYKLQQKLEEAYNKMPAERTRFDKDLLKLDEQINIFHQLINYQMLNLFPKEDDPNHKWYAPGDDLSGFAGKDSMFVSRIMGWYLAEVQDALQGGDWSKANEVIDMISTYQQAKNKTLDISPKKIETELKYNKMDVFRQCKKGYLILGGLMLVLSFAMLFKQQKWMKAGLWIVGIGVLAVFLLHMYGMGMRWYIAGYAPWSNSYETMVYVAWATVLAGLLFVRRSTVTFALATLFGGIILFVSGLNWMDPEINPLVPVLKSPWLMFHVAVIVAAYGFFGISCLIGLTNLVMTSIAGKKNTELLKARVKELTIVNEMSLWVGLALMTIGTFLGAVWANESWGRYWGWDPKETWALITMVVYAVVVHLHLVRRWYSDWLFNLCSVVAFSSVLMTFFGVNYFLSGMHSYGQNDNVHGIFTYLYIAGAVVIILGILSRIGYNKTKEE